MEDPEAQPTRLKGLAGKIKTLWENRASVIDGAEETKLKELRSISTAILGATDADIEAVVNDVNEKKKGKAAIQKLGNEITEGVGTTEVPKDISSQGIDFLLRRVAELGLHVLKKPSEPVPDPKLPDQGGRRKTYRKLRKLRKGRRSTRRRGGNPFGKLLGNKPKSPFTSGPTQPAGQEQGDAKRLDAAVGTQDEATSREAVNVAVAARKGGRSTKSRRRR
jgi:hypothetical protein